MPPKLSDDQLDALADRVIDRLDTGRHGDRWLLSRRQILALGGMGLSATGLMALGVDEATAQSAAGQVGTSGSPVDLFAADVQAQSVSITSGTIDEGKEIPGIDSTSAGGAAFASWTQVSANRPALVEVTGVAQTDGSQDGELRLNLDESGGENADYYLFVVRSHSSKGSGVFSYGSATALLPAGAKYEIQNTVDPNNNNAITHIREFTL